MTWQLLRARAIVSPGWIGIQMCLTRALLATTDQNWFLCVCCLYFVYGVGIDLAVVRKDYLSPAERELADTMDIEPFGAAADIEPLKPSKACSFLSSGAFVPRAMQCLSRRCFGGADLTCGGLLYRRENHDFARLRIAQAMNLVGLVAMTVILEVAKPPEFLGDYMASTASMSSTSGTATAGNTTATPSPLHRHRAKEWGAFLQPVEAHWIVPGTTVDIGQATWAVVAWLATCCMGSFLTAYHAARPEAVPGRVGFVWVRSEAFKWVLIFNIWTALSGVFLYVWNGFITNIVVGVGAPSVACTVISLTEVREGKHMKRKICLEQVWSMGRGGAGDETCVFVLA